MPRPGFQEAHWDSSTNPEAYDENGNLKPGYEITNQGPTVVIGGPADTFNKGIGGTPVAHDNGRVITNGAAIDPSSGMMMGAGGAAYVPKPVYYGGYQEGARDAVQQYRDAADAAGSRDIHADTRAADMTRMQQLAALDQIRQSSLGNGPSVAQAQTNYGLQGSLLASQAAMASGRGGNGAGSYLAGVGAAGAAGNVIGQGQLARGNELNAYRDLYASGGGAMRGADMQQHQYDVNNLINQRGINDKAQLGYEGMAGGVYSDALQANMKNENRYAGQSNYVQGGDFRQAQADAARRYDQEVTGIQAAATAAGTAAQVGSKFMDKKKKGGDDT